MSKTKIHSVTVAHRDGNCYWIGKKVNSMTIYEIIDLGQEFPSSIFSGYLGKTEGGDSVFCIENAPVDVQYYDPESRIERTP